MWGRSPYRKSLQKQNWEVALQMWGSLSLGGRYPNVGVAPLRVSLSCNQAVLLLSHATNPKGRRQGQSLQNYEITKGRRQGQSLQNYEIRFSFGKHVLEHISNKPKTWQHNVQSITTKNKSSTHRFDCHVEFGVRKYGIFQRPQKKYGDSAGKAINDKACKRMAVQ